MADYQNDVVSTMQTRAAPADKSSGSLITASTFSQMLNVLEDLVTHNHTFYDDYTTVCECQCQCDCNRGTL